MNWIGIILILIAVLYIALFLIRHYSTDNVYEFQHFVIVDGVNEMRYFNYKDELLCIIYRSGATDFFVKEEIIPLFHLFKIRDIEENFDFYLKRYSNVEK